MVNKLRQGRWALVAPALLASLACGTASPEDAERSDGPPVWSASPRPSVTIGVQEGDPEYLFQRIASVRLLSEGRVAVADRGFASVRVFDDEGAHLVGMGGPGEGPGEFGWMQHMAVTGADTLLVYDGEHFRITRFLADGTLVGTWPVRPEGGRPEVYLGSYANGDAAIAWIADAGTAEHEAIPDLMRMGRFGPDGVLEEVLGDATGMRRMGRGPVPFSPYLHAFLLHDSIFQTDGREPSIFVLGDSGAVARSIHLDLPEVNAAEAWGALRDELAARDRDDALASTPTEAESEPIPWIAEVLLDDADRFWVKQYEPRTDSHMLGGWSGAPGGSWTVVEADGSVVAQITLPEDFVLFDIRGWRLAGIIRDELGVERVAVFDFGR